MSRLARKRLRRAPIQQVGFMDGETAPPATAPVDLTEPSSSPGYRIWGRIDYTVMWMTKAPITVPLISTNTPPNIGALSEPGTKILYGAGSGEDTSFGGFAGIRASIGGWFDPGYEFAWELTGFAMETRTLPFSATSPGGKAPIVSIPFNATQPFNGNPAGETALNSGGAFSRAEVYQTSQLWGLELNEICIAGGTKEAYWAVILGVRYLDLTENLTLKYATDDATTGGSVAVTDGFGTRNQFYGAQVGAKGAWELGRFTIETGMLLGLGEMAETIHIAGATTVTNGAFGLTTGTTPGGVFAEPSNIGTTRRTLFAFVPEFNLKVGYALSAAVQPFIGYDAMWLSNVARPGNQIDRNINPTQSAFFAPPGTLTGPASPLATVRGTDMWVQGLQFGVEIRY